MAIKDPTNTTIATLAPPDQTPPVNAATGAQMIPLGKRPYHTELISALYHMLQTMRGIGYVVRASGANATTINITPGRTVLDGVLLIYNGGELDLVLLNNDTALVYLDNDGANNARIVAVASGVGWPATRHIKLAEVTLAAGLFDEQADIVDRKGEGWVNNQAAFVADSVAVDVAGVVADLNTLKTALVTAGLMASS